MFGTKIKISKELLEKLKMASEKLGASSVDEYAAKILEENADSVLLKSESNKASSKQIDQISEKLKGLGYLE